ncbi:MAG TPA: cysteine desulfurase [Deltaproteobacteria bacterium]|nr:cysteine desulfurase [Deltaproteobacteria bacterium]
MKITYLDHMSANPLLPEVKAAMIDAINQDFGNPSSQHTVGEQAAEVLDRARGQVADLINCREPREIVFTSCGTESVNQAIKGIAFAHGDKGRHIVTSNIEHNAVIRSLRRLKAMDYTVTSVSVDDLGKVKPDDVANAIREDTILISIMHSNNEVGTLQPIEELVRVAKEKKVPFHTDAVDSVGVVPVDVQKLGVDLLSFASNPFYGPTGVGGLYVRRGTRIFPLLDGGVQEHNRRAGAENLVGIVGMGVAAELAKKEMTGRIGHSLKLKEKLLSELPNYIDEFIINGHSTETLPNLISISIKYIEGESVVLMLDDEKIAVSTRSACATGSLRTSHVLQSIGREYADAQGTLIVTFGKENTEEDVIRFLTALRDVVKTLRDISPLYRKSSPTAGLPLP